MKTNTNLLKKETDTAHQVVKKIWRLSLTVVLCWIAMGAMLVYAQPRTVNSTDDPGDGSCLTGGCTLREAIADAIPGDTIDFDLPPSSTIFLVDGQLVIDKNLTIEGPGIDDLSISGSGNSRVFYIDSGATVRIKNLTVTGGNENSGNGGGILNNDGNLTLFRVAITDSHAENGGGLAIENGKVKAFSTDIIGNDADVNGGGIWNGSSSTQKFFFLRVLYNTAGEDGGGIYNDGGTVKRRFMNYGGNEPNNYSGTL